MSRAVTTILQILVRETLFLLANSYPLYTSILCACLLNILHARFNIQTETIKLLKNIYGLPSVYYITFINTGNNH